MRRAHRARASHEHPPSVRAHSQLEPFEPAHPPRAPVYDGQEWVATHYPRYGYAARGPLYSWRDWADAALPPQDAAAYRAVERLMADDEQRGGLVKQAQWVSAAPPRACGALCFAGLAPDVH